MLIVKCTFALYKSLHYETINSCLWTYAALCNANTSRGEWDPYKTLAISLFTIPLPHGVNSNGKQAWSVVLSSTWLVSTSCKSLFSIFLHYPSLTFTNLWYKDRMGSEHFHIVCKFLTQIYKSWQGITEIQVWFKKNLHLSSS